jgi:hypothetical protein
MEIPKMALYPTSLKGSIFAAQCFTEQSHMLLSLPGGKFLLTLD